MNILVIGGGGREHALCWKLSQSSRPNLHLYCAPGNAGIAELAECVPLNGHEDAHSLAQFVEEKGIELTIVGPEVPLAAGIVDYFEGRGLRIAGASRSAARLESSKAFAKDFMSRHKIPTAHYRIATSAQEARGILESDEFGEADAAVVIKADGLAAGKGVRMARSRSEALNAVDELMLSHSVGKEAAQSVVIEETLEGREASLLLFTDGYDFALMPPARDHKRIGENDTGPNTGGMGAITSHDILDDETLRRVVREIVEPTLNGANAEGFVFRGILFVGLMLTSDGPRVLEYNVRFGDPEAQAILPRLQTDLVEVFESVAGGTLGNLSLEWTDDASACVVLAARGYPTQPETGAQINGLARAAKIKGVQIFHAGTSRSGAGEWLTDGGRVLGVTATGATLDAALDLCYNAVDEINWDGMQYRRDIGRFI
jgi:phosphoribosylamine--glycine ligase